MTSTKSIRDVYQILRDRFAGKCRKAALYDVSLTENGSCVLTSTIHGSQSFVTTFKENEELIQEILEIFDIIVENYTERGYFVNYGRPSLKFMQSLDDAYIYANYHRYFKDYHVVIQITISEPR